MINIIETNIVLYEDVPIEATEFVEVKPWVYYGKDEAHGYKFTTKETGIDLVNDPDIEVRIDVSDATVKDVESMVEWFETENHSTYLTHFEPVSHDDAEDIEVPVKFTFTEPYYDGDKHCMITTVDEIILL